MGAERRMYGRISPELLEGLRPLLRGRDLAPVRLSVRVALEEPAEEVISEIKARTGLEVDPVEMSRHDLLAPLIGPRFREVVERSRARPGSVWVPTPQALWDGLAGSEREQLLSNHLGRLKVAMGPLAQRHTLLPLGVVLRMAMDDPEDEDLAQQVADITELNIEPVDLGYWAAVQMVKQEDFNDGPLSPEDRLAAWRVYVSETRLRQLAPLVESHDLRAVDLRLVVGLEDPDDWTIIHELRAATELEVETVPMTREQIRQGLRERLGSPEDELVRYTALVSQFPLLDRLVPLIRTVNLRPMDLVLELGMAHTDWYAVAELRLLTGLVIKPIKMDGPAVVAIAERMLADLL